MEAKLQAAAPRCALLTVFQVGLNYICATAERFFAVGAVLGNMVVAQAQVQDLPSQRLLKHIIRCYLRLSDNPRCGRSACVFVCTSVDRVWRLSVCGLDQQALCRVLCTHACMRCRAREALRSCLPELLRNPQFTGSLKNDDTTR
eukprot:1160875-Pelagomonas_calceolata.AAC.4